MAKQWYPASSGQRSERLAHASCGNGRLDCPQGVSTDAPESASTTDSQFQFEAHPATHPNTECQPSTTLMLCGIPCRLGPQEVVDVIDEKGFSSGLCLNGFRFDNARLCSVCCSASDNACVCLFEGVCLTPVILAPGARGGGV